MEKSIKEVLNENPGMVIIMDNIDRNAPSVEADPENEIRKYWNRVYNPPTREYALREYYMTELKEIIKQRGNLFLNKDNPANPVEFVIDEFNEPIIELLIKYFLKSADFETEHKFSLKRGIMLQSENKGSGKTLLMKLFSNAMYWQDDVRFNSYNFNHVVNCRKVISQYRNDGDKIYSQYCENIFNTTGTQNDYMFDELGREDTQALYFGNRTNVMEKILADRYDLFIDHGIKTHITTNIMDGNDIEKLYGDYIRSRMREMFNVIELPGKDRRK